MARQLTCSAILLLIAAGYYSVASQITRSALADEVGPAGLPVVYALVLATVALALAAKAVFRPLLLRTVDVTAAAGEPTLGFLLRRAGGVFAIGVGYVLIVPLAGYFLTLVGVIVAMALYQGERASARLATIAVAGSALFWLLFVHLLGIPMPSLWGA
jgi:hypothetical protein